MPLTDPYMAAAAAVYNSGAAEASSFGDTLCTALANEQHAHRATKMALNQHITRCLELEEQLNKTKQQIASMSVTINNLGAIVKHNASKQSSEESGSYDLSERSAEAEEVALREFYREYNKLKNAAKEREEQNEKADLGQNDDDNSTCKDAASTLASTTADVSVDDAQLYNLDLLQKPDPDDSTDSILRRTLRKHFSIDSSASDGKVTSTPSKSYSSLNKLIDVSPVSAENAKDMVENPPKTGNGIRAFTPTSTQMRLLVR
jgi:hypothetical protein